MAVVLVPASPAFADGSAAGAALIVEFGGAARLGCCSPAVCSAGFSTALGLTTLGLAGLEMTGVGVTALGAAAVGVAGVGATRLAVSAGFLAGAGRALAPGCCTRAILSALVRGAVAAACLATRSRAADFGFVAMVRAARRRAASRGVCACRPERTWRDHAM